MGASDKLVSDLQAVLTDTEELIQATAGQGGERIEQVRVRAEQSLRAARAQLAAGRDALERQVQANPWRALGAAVGVGVLLGLLLSRR